MSVSVGCSITAGWVRCGVTGVQCDLLLLGKAICVYRDPGGGGGGSLWVRVEGQSHCSYAIRGGNVLRRIALWWVGQQVTKGVQAKTDTCRSTTDAPIKAPLTRVALAGLRGADSRARTVLGPWCQKCTLLRQQGHGCKGQAQGGGGVRAPKAAGSWMYPQTANPPMPPPRQ